MNKCSLSLVLVEGGGSVEERVSFNASNYVYNNQTAKFCPSILIFLIPCIFLCS